MLTKVLNKASLQINIINVIFLIRITEDLLRHLFDFITLRYLLAVVYGTVVEAYTDLLVI